VVFVSPRRDQRVSELEPRWFFKCLEQWKRVQLKNRGYGRKSWQICFEASGRGVDMTIRGAVSGRMKTTLACVVESRASGQAAVWGDF
jgi:hypothetical protein